MARQMVTEEEALALQASIHEPLDTQDWDPTCGPDTEEGKITPGHQFVHLGAPNAEGMGRLGGRVEKTILDSRGLTLRLGKGHAAAHEDVDRLASVR